MGEKDWLNANDRIRLYPEAALLIARSYGHDLKTGRNTAVCASSMNTPLWQESVARCYQRSVPMTTPPTFADGMEAAAMFNQALSGEKQG